MRPIESFQSVLLTGESQENSVDMRKLNKQQQDELDDILERYNVVFQELSGLPPQREAEHKIELRGTGDPTCVRP